MISVCKKYHIAYWCIGIALLIGMELTIIFLRNEAWYYQAGTLLVAMAFVFILLTNKKPSKEVFPYFQIRPLW